MFAIGIRKEGGEPELFDVAKPEPGEGEVLVRTIRIGICGTDREIIESGKPDVPEGSDFLILGHEALGRVEALGRGVEGIEEGQLVVPSVRRPLDGDYGCRPDFLEPGNYTERGIYREQGYGQEFWVEEPAYLTKVPEHLEPIAVLSEPFSIVEKAINEAVAVQRARLGEVCPTPEFARALVVGPGPVGFAAAFVCLAHGFETSIAGRDDEGSPKVAFSRSLGLDYVDTRTVDFEKLAADGKGFDLIVEAAGVGWLVFEIAKALEARGVLALTGISGEHDKKDPIDANLFMTEAVMRNKLIFGSVNAAMRDFEDAVSHLEWADAHHSDKIRRLITGRYPVAEFAEAYKDELDRSRAPNGIKTVIDFSSQ